MRFELSEDQALLRQSTRDFLTAELPLEKTRKLMEHDPRGYDVATWRRLAEMGYVGLTVPARAGGQGLGAVELAIVCEEMGRVCAPGPYLDAALAAHLLGAAGGHDALLAELCAGTKLVTMARLDTPYAGGSCDATRFEGGRVRGQKWFVPFGEFADALIVTTPDGLCLAGAPFDVSRLATLDPSRRYAKVVMQQGAVRVDRDALEPTDRFGSVGAAAMLLGIMSWAMDTTLRYLQTREAFRRPIGAFQALQHRMADVLLRVESTRSAVYRAAWCLDTQQADAALACAAAKAYAAEASRVVCGEAIQMHGGIGFTWELDLHFYFKRAKTLEQHHGSTEEQLQAALAAAGF